MKYIKGVSSGAFVVCFGCLFKVNTSVVLWPRACFHPSTVWEKLTTSSPPALPKSSSTTVITSVKVCLNTCSLVFEGQMFKCLKPSDLLRLFTGSSEGDLDSLLENATVENSESSSLSSSQESAEDRSAKTGHSPKESHAESLKESPGRNDAASSSKDTCQGRKHTGSICVKVFP